MTGTVRFFVDECCPRDVVVRLRSLGYDVAYAGEAGQGVADTDHAAAALFNGRIVVTADYDFTALAVRDERPFVGLVVLAPDVDLRRGRASGLADRLLESGELPGWLTLLERDRIRRRPL